MRRIAGGVWIPVNEEEEISPVDGCDIISTIHINIQDVAHSALKKQLIASDSKWGTAILMEVSSGAICAIANLSRVRERSEERSVGKECVSTSRSRGLQCL